MIPVDYSASVDIRRYAAQVHNSLYGRPNMTSHGDKVTFSSESKYYPLHAHLSRVSGAGQLHMEFGQLEDIIGQPLPVGARSHRAWWANGRNGHSQSRAWLLAGWRVANVDLTGEKVTFERTA
jgi:hypothetical protein